MRRTIELGKVVSSHSVAWGRISLIANRRIVSRSWSCSSVKMKCLRALAWSGLRTSEVLIRRTLVPRHAPQPERVVDHDQIEVIRAHIKCVDAQPYICVPAACHPALAVGCAEQLERCRRSVDSDLGL